MGSALERIATHHPIDAKGQDSHDETLSGYFTDPLATRYKGTTESRVPLITALAEWTATL